MGVNDDPCQAVILAKAVTWLEATCHRIADGYELSVPINYTRLCRYPGWLQAMMRPGGWVGDWSAAPEPCCTPMMKPSFIRATISSVLP